MTEQQEREKYIREQLETAIKGHQAHIDFDAALKGFHAEQAGLKPHGAPHSAWELLEHVRITQRDILDFSRGDGYKELKWPDDYWPKSPTPPSKEAWQASIDAFRKDRAEFEKLLENAASDLYKRLPHGSGQTLFREALLIASHNSYHLGQFVYLRRMLEARK